MSRESLWAYYRDDDVPLYQHTADTELEVLMQEAPFGAGGLFDPGHSIDGESGSGPRPGSSSRRSARRAAFSPQLVREDTDLGDALFAVVEEILTDRERFVLEAWVYERLGVRAIGQQLSLSKSQVHRILQGALKKLRVQLSTSPAIVEWLARCGEPPLVSLSLSAAVQSEETPCFLEESLEADHI